MKPGKIARGIAVAVTALTFLIGCFAAAYILTALGFRLAGYDIRASRPPQLLPISLVLGAIFAGVIWWYLAHRDMSDYSGQFKPVIRTLEQISKGEFDVRLENSAGNSAPYSELVESVNSMAADLSQIEKMRREFVSNVSHEIHSPLTSIRGFAQALKNKDLEEEKRLHYLNIIETESMRLSKLSDNLLRLAALESGNVTFEPKEYRLDRQIRDLVLACEPQWTGKELELDVQLSEMSIVADEELLSQVWLNLLHNSIKFTPAHGKIKIDLHARGDRAVIRLSDTGIGISEEALPHIFDRFYKADKSRARSNEGSGLGLSIVKKIVDMHHGAIEVQSESAQGTIITVSLPLR